MSFHSIHAHLIWDKLRSVSVPDLMTQDPNYLRVYGHYTTGDKEVDEMIATNFTSILIPVSKMLEYFEDGVEIRIPSRETMISIHKDIELYLNEWRERIKYDINIDVGNNRELILSLEKLSEYIFNRAAPDEVIDNLFLTTKMGLMSPLARLEYDKKNKEVAKSPYQGIRDLVRSKTSKPLTRFS